MTYSRYVIIGKSLRLYVQINNPSNAQIYAWLVDNLAGDDILLIMKDVIARREFADICANPGAVPGSPLLRDAFLQILGETYLPEKVLIIGDILSGLMDLSSPLGDQRGLGAQGFPDENEVLPVEDVPIGSAYCSDGASRHGLERPRALKASEVCDENLWNRQRDPQKDVAFLKSWTLKWFNRRYRPRLVDE